MKSHPLSVKPDPSNTLTSREELRIRHQSSSEARELRASIWSMEEVLVTDGTCRGTLRLHSRHSDDCSCRDLRSAQHPAALAVLG